MISPEEELFTLIATALRSAYTDIYVSGEYVSQPPKFPAVSIVENANVVVTRTQDTSNLENHAEITYQVDVYSNLDRGKKLQAKTILGMIDVLMNVKGFTRIFMNPVQNLNDPKIYRMTARYRAIVGKDNQVYRG